LLAERVLEEKEAHEHVLRRRKPMLVQLAPRMQRIAGESVTNSA